MEETTSTVPNNKNETKNACNTKTIPEEKYCFCFLHFLPFWKDKYRFCYATRNNANQKTDIDIYDIGYSIILN